MEAASIPNQPIEQAGMTADVIQKLQDKGTILTQERKRRGRNIPEELMSQDYIINFHTYASHPVSLYFRSKFSYEKQNIAILIILGIT